MDEFRGQELVLSSEINFEGPLTQLAFDLAGTHSNCLYYEFELYLCHTPLGELTNNLNDNYGGNTPELVASADPLDVSGADGWWPVPGFSAFEYNGEENLLVELRWRGNNTQSVDMWAFLTDTPRFTATAEYDGEIGSDPKPMCHRFRLTFQPDLTVLPRSIGEVKAAFN